MDIDKLKRLPAFAARPLPELEALAAGARRVRLPARRWLVQPGRVLVGHYYLLEGRVRVVGPDGLAEIVAGGSVRAVTPVHPGSMAVETLLPSLFLRVEPDSAGWPEGVPGVPEVCWDDDAWQRRFLTSPLLQRFAPAAWQRILRAMSRHQHEPGARILTAGTTGDRCYVLCSGSAEVAAADGRRLALLQPGALFGEDALISGAVRNASVTMLGAGATVSLPADDFDALLLRVVVRPVEAACGRQLISLDRPAPPGAVAVGLAEIRDSVPRLAPVTAYAIIGGTVRERALAAFLLAQRGVDAAPLI